MGRVLRVIRPLQVPLTLNPTQPTPGWHAAGTQRSTDTHLALHWHSTDPHLTLK